MFMHFKFTANVISIMFCMVSRKMWEIFSRNGIHVIFCLDSVIIRVILLDTETIVWISSVLANFTFYHCCSYYLIHG